MNTHFNKKILFGICTASLIFGGGGALAQSKDEIELTIVSWGGAYSQSQKNAYHLPYMKKNPHINIINDDSSNDAVAKLRAQNEAGNITWDLIDMNLDDAIRVCDEGLAMEINVDSVLAAAPDGTPPSEDFGDALLSPCLVPQIVFSDTFGYRTDVAAWQGKVPTSIADVFDLEKFPGTRSLEKRPIHNLEWALIADGVPTANVYEVLATKAGVDRAFAKLDTIKDDVIWWTKGADTPDRLARNEVVIGSTYNGRLFELIEVNKQPVAMLWDAQIFQTTGWIVPAGLSDKRKKAVLDFLYFSTDTQRLADQAKWIPYGPTRKSSVKLVGTHAELGIDMAPHMPNYPKNAERRLTKNIEFWADHRDELDGRFLAWLDN